MQVLRMKIIAAAGLFLLLSTGSCKKWINDTPEPLQVDDSIIFAKEQGFREVLNGVYLQMGAKSLYGRDLTVGVLSVLGRSYDLNVNPSSDNLYNQTALYNLQDPGLKNYASDLWTKMYQAISNLNNLLLNIEKRKEMFTGNNYQTFKGEALALRAYLHFDLLRLFAAAPASGTLTATGIPYVTTVGTSQTPVSNLDQVMEQCIGDLKTAESLLNPSEASTVQINHWAVKALLSRLYLYKNDQENAQKYAYEVINSKRFILAKNNTDLLFIKESLFGLLVQQNGPLHKTVFGEQVNLGFSSIAQTELYVAGSGSTVDWRKSFVDPLTGFANGPLYMPKKFFPLGAKSAFPMIRLTEMYYIAAECAVNNRDSLTATALLDSVRVHRNLQKYSLSALKRDSLKVEIGKEYLKEFMGEGQSFFYFKRKNIPFASLPFTRIPVVGNATYVFVKPE
ncbi:RagB/SusD family nutrient uptake outer membrane protein [Pedobacter gandavensis]|uniref:RagB/SusD family nutrient uptake outer membrane protein n=1 Tax=Pedobacter gandavensis TaxID=2679963 RepID=UPI002930E79E|nr:RagB/SusD family nutrient uptake outer membrane protein [Pedobacter gandavensis]